MAPKFKKRLTDAGIRGNSYWYGDNPFSNAGYGLSNCTCYAWGRFWEIADSAVGKVHDPSNKPSLSTGDAYTFYTHRDSYKRGNVPKLGAIACYSGGNFSGLGHVCIVEEIDTANKRCLVSESAYNGYFFRAVHYISINGDYGYGGYTFQGFIYNPVNFGGSAGQISSQDSSKDKSWYISQYGIGAEVYFELAKYGYSHKACCAVLGNMQQESGIRVYTGGSYDGNGSEGLCQWTFGRKTSMQSYAAEHSASHSWKSVDGQVAYLVHELKNSEKSANTVLQNDSLSLEEMTKEFEEEFERADPNAANLPARVEYAKDWDRKMSGASGAGNPQNEAVQTADMVNRISRLYSSANFEYLDSEKGENKAKENLGSIKKTLTKLFTDTNFSDITKNNTTAAIPEILLKGPEKIEKELINKVEAKFSLSQELVQAPFVEISLDGYTIGSYKSSLDDYPNYISQLNVKKINGEINQYTINLIHQIRPGEDPNLLDKLFSIVRYKNISIRYGDCQSGMLFKDADAIITNIVQNRDYSSSRITYTLYATSIGKYITSVKFNFKATNDRPSNVIRDLLYKNSETSKLLLDAFPGMRDKNKVNSKNLLPNDDSVIHIQAKNNIGVLSYINYLVGCMSNNSNNVKSIIRNSLYFITYSDDKNGAFFKITKVSKQNKISSLTRNIFEVTVGYPDGNDIYDFRINNNESWAMLYENLNPSSEYIYNINSNGDSLMQYSPNLVSSSNILNETQKNWWTQMVSFPISAQLTMKGLLKPVMLMDYVQINVVFYGRRHLTSGLYVITGQEDSLSGSGFSTTLNLLRVEDKINS